MERDKDEQREKRKRPFKSNVERQKKREGYLNGRITEIKREREKQM